MGELGELDMKTIIKVQSFFRGMKARKEMQKIYGF
jgi:hypothetical protein